MFKIPSLILFIFLFQFTFAQKEVVEIGEYQSQLYSNESQNDAKKRIKELAIINALEKAFGVAVFQGNSMYIKNTTTGNKVETKTGFNSIADTYVKGEIVEEIDVKYTEIPYEKKINGKIERGIDYKCEVKIRAREFIEPTADFNAFPMNCDYDTLLCKTTSFKKNESFYVYFKSPKNGYLTIFLDDNESASILLPYISNREKYQKGFPIEANKTYVFFKNDKKYFDATTMIVDELEWDTRENLEKLNIIFSIKPFEVPDLNIAKSKELPQNLPSVEFNKWLIKLRKSSKTLELLKIPISTD